MKRFQFRLDRVLEWRQSRLEIELTRLGVLTARAREIDQRRRQVQADYAAAEQSLISAADVEASDLAALDNYRVWSRQEAERLAARRAECERQIGEQRQVVLEARRGCRLLERLKQKRLAEWTAESDREIEGLAAELYLARRSNSVARST